MDRRTFLKILTAGAVGGTLGLPSSAAARVSNNPNVVLIITDDLGYNDAGCYGSPDALTPYIDSIANEGVRFTQFYVNPVCTPTRFSLMTGWHVNRSADGLFSALVNTNLDKGLRSDKITIADVFKAYGYTTGVMGKWHLGTGHMVANPPENGDPDSEFHPNNHGFDYFYGALSGSIDYITHWNQDVWPDWFENKNYISGTESGDYATHLFTNKAVQFINDHKDEPFFLYLPYTAPHSGNVPKPRTALEQDQLPVGEETDRIYLSRFDHLWPPSQDTTNVRKRFLSMIAVLDDGIGEILDTLRTNGLEENTIVVFISDNGGRGSFGGSNDPLRSEKAHVYEGGIRTPAMMKWKGVIPEGVESDQIGAIWDMFLTIGRLAGFPMCEYRTDGIDLRENIFKNKIVERDLFYENPKFGKVYRRGKWKYVRDYKTTDKDELYDLEADIGETNNLASTYPEKMDELKALHAQQVAALDDPPPFPPTSTDAKHWGWYS